MLSLTAGLKTWDRPSKMTQASWERLLRLLGMGVPGLESFSSSVRPLTASEEFLGVVPCSAGPLLFASCLCLQWCSCGGGGRPYWPLFLQLRAQKPFQHQDVQPASRPPFPVPVVCMAGTQLPERSVTLKTETSNYAAEYFIPEINVLVKPHCSLIFNRV